MKFYPNVADQTPLSTIFWVPTHSGNIVPTEAVYETPEATKARLESDFPAYRVLQVSKKIAARIIGSSYEV